MGGKSSKRAVSSRHSSYGSTSNSWAYPQSPYPQSPYPQQPVSQPYASPSSFQSYPERAPAVKRKLERKYSRIDDNFNNLEQVTSFSMYTNTPVTVVSFS